MPSLPHLPDFAHTMKDTFGFYDDFLHESTVAAGGRWIETHDGVGTVAMHAGSVGGVLVITTSAVDEEADLIETPEVFLFADDKPIIWGARVQFTEANTDDANVLVGLLDAPAGTSMQAAGAGPPGTYSGCLFFKEDGQTVWTVEDSVGTGQKTTQLTAANSLDELAKTAGTAALANWQWLECEVKPVTSTDNRFSFFIDGVLVARHIGRTTASATEMAMCLFIGAGDTNVETLNVDAAYAFQKR